MSFRASALPIPKEGVDLDKVPPSREACACASFRGNFIGALKLLALYLTGSSSSGLANRLSPGTVPYELQADGLALPMSP